MTHDKSRSLSVKPRETFRMRTRTKESLLLIQQRAASFGFDPPQEVDPCHEQLMAVAASLADYDNFMDTWEPIFLARVEALEACRIQNPEGPSEP